MAQSHAAGPPTHPSPQVLQWLHRVIAPVYHDAQRTYTDVASALAGIRTLSPKTEIYTYENGATELLLHLSGTLQAIFRGSNFSVPVSIWVPHQYPKLPPMVFVTPQKDIVVRPGNHVDPSGRCYHPYLANWVNFSDRSNIYDLCEALRGVFSREPPVMARQTAHQQQQQNQPAPPPRPPRPQELGGGERTPEPKPSPAPGPPPVPPLPSELAGSAVPAGRGSPYAQSPVQQTPPPHAQHQPTPPPVPPLPPHPGREVASPQPGPPPPQYRPPPQHYSPSGPAPPPPPPKPRAPHPGEIAASPHSPSPLSPHYTGRPASVHIPSQFSPQIPPSPTQRPRPVSMQPVHPPQQPHTGPPPYPMPPVSKPTPPPPQRSLLDESDPVPTPSPVPTGAPPPPPPNPEKDHLIHNIALAMHDLAVKAHTTTAERLQLAAKQHSSLQAAESMLERERAELQHISDMCGQNADILKERIAAAERVIEEAKRTEPPGVDECVAAPSVLHNQLYELVAEDTAIEECIYVLGKALDGEKVGLEGFMKHVRVLAREQFMKKALARKIAVSLGLDMGDGEV